MSVRINHALVLIILLSSVGISRATLVLSVDVSDPSAVTFTSTLANGQGPGTILGLAVNGMNLLGFFSGNTTTLTGSVASGSLGVLNQDSPGGSRDVLDEVFIGTFNPGNWTPDDVSFLETSPGGFHYARTDTQAITGSVTLNLSSFVLPAAGHSGDVVIDPPDALKVIGQYSVVGVPEPSSFLFLSLIACGGIAYRWKRISGSSN